MSQEIRQTLQRKDIFENFLFLGNYFCPSSLDSTFSPRHCQRGSSKDWFKNHPPLMKLNVNVEMFLNKQEAYERHFLQIQTILEESSNTLHRPKVSFVSSIKDVRQKMVLIPQIFFPIQQAGTPCPSLLCFQWNRSQKKSAVFTSLFVQQIIISEVSSKLNNPGRNVY